MLSFDRLPNRLLRIERDGELIGLRTYPAENASAGKKTRTQPED